VFDVADDVFSAELTGLSFAEMRRWLFGPPKNTASSRKPRRQGLKRRLENTVPEHHALWQTVENTLYKANFLPEQGWLERVTNHKTDTNVAEGFLAAVAQHVQSNQAMIDAGMYDLEAPFENIGLALQTAASDLANNVQEFLQALNRLLIDLDHYHDQLPAEPLTLDTRQQIKLVQRQLRLRALYPVQQWLGVLAALIDPTQKPADTIMWLAVHRIDGRMYDTGAHAHALDPTTNLAALWQQQTHSVTFTSATLKPRSGNIAADWQRAHMHVGLHHLPQATQDDVWRYRRRRGTRTGLAHGPRHAIYR
jgi:ATP-dependent DNA helicase DinG